MYLAQLTEDCLNQQLLAIICQEDVVSMHTCILTTGIIGVDKRWLQSHTPWLHIALGKLQSNAVLQKRSISVATETGKY